MFSTISQYINELSPIKHNEDMATSLPASAPSSAFKINSKSGTVLSESNDISEGEEWGGGRLLCRTKQRTMVVVRDQSVGNSNLCQRRDPSVVLFFDVLIPSAGSIQGAEQCISGRIRGSWSNLKLGCK